MTVEEIKATHTMKDILRMYGFQPNRAGFIRCPFHSGDNTASMKIYKDSFHCFGCGENGDIFTFIMKMDGISFRDAFLSLGGHYDRPENPDEARRRTRERLVIQQKHERERLKLERKKREMLTVGHEMDIYRTVLHGWKPFTPEWENCMNGYLTSLFKYERLREEVNKLND